MLPSHARTLCEARSALAVLSDRAQRSDASSAFEHVLIALDSILGDDGPAIDPKGLPADEDGLLALAGSALGRLRSHGVDPLHVELLLAMLDDAAAVGL